MGREVVACTTVAAGRLDHICPVVTTEHDRMAGHPVVRRASQRRAVPGKSLEEPVYDGGPDVWQIDQADQRADGLAFERVEQPHAQRRTHPVGPVLGMDDPHAALFGQRSYLADGGAHHDRDVGASAVAKYVDRMDDKLSLIHISEPTRRTP